MADLLGNEPPATPRRTRASRKVDASTGLAGEGAGTERTQVPAPADLVPISDAADYGSPLPMLSKMVELASNPAFDENKTKALNEIFKDWSTELAKRDWAAAMNAAQMELEPVVKKSWNDQTRSFYAKLEAVTQEVMPTIWRHGFSVGYADEPPILAPGNIRIACIVTHKHGHSERFAREAPPDTTGPKGGGTKTALHGANSTDTQLKKYALCGAFNIILKGLDNDGQGAVCNEAQVKHLRSLVMAIQNLSPATDEARLCKALHLRADTLDDLPIVKYGEALSMLTGKLGSLTAEASVALKGKAE